MIYLLNNRLIHIEWSIFKGTSQVREDFSRSLVKVFLIGPDEKYLLNATAQNGTLTMDVPQGLPEGAYSIECIYVKNYESLLSVRGTLTPSGEPVCHRFPWGHPHNPHSIHPHDHRSNDRCLMRSRMDYVFALTSVPSEADGVSSDGEATLRFKSSVASYGYDGLSAYEIAVMRGDFNGSEGEWLEWMTPKEIEIDDALSETSGNPVENRVMTKEFNKKQNSLVSGKNIKTLNGQSILGEGNISITGEGTAITVENEFGQSTENPGSQKLITQVNESVGKANENITKISNSLTETNESIKIVSDSVNAIADDEDLVLVESEDEEEEITKKLKFADKAYNASSFSGMGRAYLRKNITGGKNVLTQAMMDKANTRYVIQYDYDLDGETVTVPEGCTLDFQGGSFKNGTLYGNLTEIVSSVYKIFSLDLSIKGSWNLKYSYPEWFMTHSQNVDFSQSIQKCIDSFHLFSTVKLVNREYTISNTINIGPSVTIKGLGPFKTTLNINEEINCFEISNSAFNVFIEGMSIYTEEGKGLSGILLNNNNGGWNHTFKNIDFKYFKNGIKFTSVFWQSTIRDCIFQGCNNGIFSEMSGIGSNIIILIDHCFFNYCRNKAINVYGTSELVINNCNFGSFRKSDAKESSFVQITLSHQFVIRNCNFEGCYLSANQGAVWINNSNGSLEECTFYDISSASASTAAIRVDGTSEYMNNLYIKDIRFAEMGTKQLIATTGAKVITLNVILSDYIDTSEYGVKSINPVLNINDRFLKTIYLQDDNKSDNVILILRLDKVGTYVGKIFLVQTPGFSFNGGDADLNLNVYSIKLNKNVLKTVRGSVKFGTCKYEGIPYFALWVSPIDYCGGIWHCQTLIGTIPNYVKKEVITELVEM